jgi:phosphatidate phosphatase PAH1
LKKTKKKSFEGNGSHEVRSPSGDQSGVGSGWSAAYTIRREKSGDQTVSDFRHQNSEARASMIKVNSQQTENRGIRIVNHELRLMYVGGGKKKTTDPVLQPGCE